MNGAALALTSRSFCSATAVAIQKKLRIEIVDLTENLTYNHIQKLYDL